MPNIPISKYSQRPNNVKSGNKSQKTKIIESSHGLTNFTELSDFDFVA